MDEIFLISCVSVKQSVRARAENLYVSPWFKLAMNYARRREPRSIYILSAKYGLTPLNQEIDPYELTLNKMSEPQIMKWAKMVLDQLKDRCSLSESHFVILAGARYRKYLVSHMDHAEIPMKGLRIGEQLKWLKEHC